MPGCVTLRDYFMKQVIALSFRAVFRTISQANQARVSRHASGIALLTVWLLSPSWSMAQALPDFTQLVDQNAPTIVNITTRQQVPTRARSGQQRELEELLRQLRPNSEEPLPDVPSRPRGGVGSGFIMS